MLIHGIQENRDQNTDEKAIATLNEKLDLELSDHDVDRTHKTGTVTPTRTKPRPIIVKFIRYAEKNKVFTNNKGLTNSKISITESLSARRMECLSMAMYEIGFKCLGSRWNNQISG